MKDIKSIFRSFEKKMKQSSWFEDGWEIYNRGEYLQLYKTNWHNENQSGIHFETYIESTQVKQKTFPIHMHVEDDCPSQQEFIQKFLAIEGDRIRSWKGYKTIGKGSSVCTRTLPLNFKNLEQRLMEEFGKLRELEGGIDQVLRDRQA